MSRIIQTTAQKRAAFRALHQQGCFVMPNAWDVGSARLLQHMGFSSVATSGAGYAWSAGNSDYAGATKSEVLEFISKLCASTDLPVNADLESGFAHDVQGVADSVKAAVIAGVAGLSIEDRDFGDASRLYSTDVAVERLRASRKAIDETGEDVILVARTEGLLIDSSAVNAAIDRLVAFADAGADCVYAPGVADKDHIAAMVRAVAPVPVNVLIMWPGMNVAELADLGVRRISVGSALAQAAWGAVMASAKTLQEGSFDGFDGIMSGGELNGIFGKFS